MGTKSQVSASLWTVLMMDKAGLFIAHAALGWETKRSSYFELTGAPSPRVCAETPRRGMVMNTVEENVRCKFGFLSFLFCDTDFECKWPQSLCSGSVTCAACLL